MFLTFYLAEISQDCYIHLFWMAARLLRYWLTMTQMVVELSKRIYRDNFQIWNKRCLRCVYLRDNNLLESGLPGCGGHRKGAS